MSALDRTNGAQNHEKPADARHALSAEFAGHLDKLPLYPGPASAGELLNAGANRLHIDQRDSIGSTMAAFKNANGWDPAVIIHLKSTGADHMKALANAGVMRETHTNNIDSIKSGSIMFGQGVDGKPQAAIKGEGKDVYRIGDDLKWVKSTADATFAKGSALDAFTQTKPLSKLTDNQRQEISLLANRPTAYGFLSDKPHGASLVDQLEHGVNTGRFTRHVGLNMDALTKASREGDQFVSKDGSVRGRVEETGKLQFWNGDRKMYLSATKEQTAEYGKKEYRLYQPVPKH